MAALQRRHFVIIAVVVLLVVALLVPSTATDTDFLGYVSTTVKNVVVEHAPQESVTSTLHIVTVYAEPTSAERTVTITTTTTPTATEVASAESTEKNWVLLEPFVAMNTTITVPQKMTFDSKGPRGDQIVLLTATDGKGHSAVIENILEMAMSNRETWTQYHGYINHFINISKYDLLDVHPVWKKLPAIVETFNTFPEAQWVFWLDLDAIIMSPWQDLQSLILSKEGMRQNFHLGAELKVWANDKYKNIWPEEPDFENVDLIMAQDLGMLNAGSFLLRRSHFTQWLLDMWADPLLMHASFAQREQQALLHLMKHHPSIREHAGIAKQRAINAFVDGPGWEKWQDGDLLVHFAGCMSFGTCAENWEKYWNMRGRLEH